MSELQTLSALTDQIYEFLRNHKNSENKFKYVDIIDSSLDSQSIVLYAKDLLQSQELELYQKLHEEPDEFIYATSQAVKNIFTERFPTKQKDFEIYIEDVENKISLVESLGNTHINKLVELTGVIISSTTMYNVPKTLVYKCPDGHISELPYESSFKMPTKCQFEKCQHRDLRVDTTSTSFVKHRTLYLKSDDDFSYHNDELEIDVSGPLTEIATTGDRVKIVGILRPRFNQRSKTFQNILSCVGIRKLDDVDLRISPEDEEIFRQYPEEPDFYQRLVSSIAPSVLGLNHIKESLLLQRIGSHDILKVDGTKVRGWFHIGLFGDPSTAKTKLGEWEVENLPRTQIVMSKGATHTGLIMGLEDGPDGRKILRAGALINCRNGGVVVLDEFPRLDPQVIDGLYTTAESGIAAISKTGYQTNIKADASLLVTGNAHDGKWNEALNVQNNLAIDGVFLQRFDFIWVLIDDFSEQKDEALANAILSDVRYLDGLKPFSAVTLSKYIKYVQSFKPELTQEVSELLKKTWLELRRDSEAKENGISPRHLNTLIRTTLSIARLYQRQYATVEDATKAINLIRQMFKQRNISISEADTYVQRCLNKSIEILKTEPISGIRIDDLFDKVLNYGSTEDQTQAKVDLGNIRSHSQNKKWREVIEVLKRSPLVKIVNQKPIILAYDHNKGDISKW